MLNQNPQGRNIAYYDKIHFFGLVTEKLLLQAVCSMITMNSMKNFQEVKKVCYDLKNTKSVDLLNYYTCTR